MDGEGDRGEHTVVAVLEVRDGQGGPPRSSTILGMRDKDTIGWVLHNHFRPFIETKCYETKYKEVD